MTEVQDYVTVLLEARRSGPGQDLISDLLAARDQGDRLSAAESSSSWRTSWPAASTPPPPS